ncbi:hypothetical protein CB1_000436020 [Camelus ferus]|nr:hypothetical protein CB1_000436020 [Camelus ferus]
MGTRDTPTGQYRQGNQRREGRWSLGASSLEFRKHWAVLIDGCGSSEATDNMAKAKRDGAKTDFTKMRHYCNFQNHHSSQKARHGQESCAHSGALGADTALAQQYMLWSELSACLHIPGQHLPGRVERWLTAQSPGLASTASEELSRRVQSSRL